MSEELNCQAVARISAEMSSAAQLLWISGHCSVTHSMTDQCIQPWCLGCCLQTAIWWGCRCSRALN